MEEEVWSYSTPPKQEASLSARGRPLLEIPGGARAKDEVAEKTVDAAEDVRCLAGEVDRGEVALLGWKKSPVTGQRPRER